MSGRITMQGVFMEFAKVVAQRSVCQRRVQVGCVITNHSMTNVVGLGYNGPARGLPHNCSPGIIDGLPHCHSGPREQWCDADASRFMGHVCRNPLPGSCTCIHAEVNALLKAPYDDVGGLVMFTTLSPCPSCARLILNSRVTSVYYLDEYRTLEGLSILKDNGIEVLRMLM